MSDIDKRYTKKARHTEEENPDRWVISYADFITLLFAFFTAMYAISHVDLGKLDLFVGSMKSAFKSHTDATKPVIEGIAPVPPSLIAMERKFKAAIELLETKEDIVVKRDERGLVISMGDSILFDTGNDALKDSAVLSLSKLGEILHGLPNDIIIEGHTDNIPIRDQRFASNWELSTTRAISVMRYFIKNHNISPLRFSVAGYGEFRPVATNATPEGRAKNRRVEIVIIQNHE